MKNLSTVIIYVTGNNKMQDKPWVSGDDCPLQQSEVNCVQRGFKWFETLSRDAAWKGVFAFLA